MYFSFFHRMDLCCNIVVFFGTIQKWQRRFFILYEHGLLRYALDEMVSKVLSALSFCSFKNIYSPKW